MRKYLSKTKKETLQKLLKTDQNKLTFCIISEHSTKMFQKTRCRNFPNLHWRALSKRPGQKIAHRSSAPGHAPRHLQRLAKQCS